MNDILIKHAINRDASEFVNIVKDVLSEKFKDKCAEIKTTIVNNLTEIKKD